MVHVVVAGWLVLNLAVLAARGVQHGGDSPRYIAGAEDVIQGRLQGKASSYLGYVSLVALSKAAGLGLVGAVAAQLLLASLAAAGLFELAGRLGGSCAGIIAACLALANLDLVRWHHYLLTDSPYASLVVLCGLFIHRAGERGAACYAWAILLCMIAALVRPNGWMLLPIATSSWVLRCVRRRGARWLIAASVFTLFGLALWRVPYFREVIARESLPVMLARGEVIWGHPAGRVEMPPAPEDGGGSAAVRYVLRYPAASARLAGARVLTELAHVRPFYSVRHNVLVAVVLGGLYAFAAAGIAAVWREPLARLLFAIIVAHLALVAVTFADWDGRFLSYVLPLIGVFSATGVSRLVRCLALRRLD